MPFLSPIKKRISKSKLGRGSKNADDMNKALGMNDSQRTSLSLSESTQDSQGFSRSSFENSKVGVLEARDYGYGDASPDTAEKNRGSTFSKQVDPFGYEVHNPSAPGTRPRRSSLKGSNRGSSSEPRRVPRRRHSISFEEEIKVNPVVPITDLVKDKGDMWLQGEDYHKIINKVNTIVDRTTTGKGPKYCVRGLEHLIQRRVGMEDEPRNDAWDTVLDEQQMQHVTGDYDEEIMSRKYRRCSNQSRMEAKIRAIQDENEVSGYLEDTRRYCRRMSL